MRKPTPKQQAIVDKYNEVGIARCHYNQAKQAYIKQWITDKNIETFNCMRSGGEYPNGFGNPYELNNYSEEERNRVCDAFQKDFDNNPINLSTLNGKLLICACQSNERCHTDTYINELAKKA